MLHMYLYMFFYMYSEADKIMEIKKELAFTSKRGIPKVRKVCMHILFCLSLHNR